jgi:hypothetical protein
MTVPIITETRPILTDAMAPVIDLLTAGGIRATNDIKMLNPPCVYLAPPELEFRFRQGDFTATYTMLLVAANTSRRLAFDEMSQLILSVQTILGERARTARPVDVPTNDGSAILLGYEFTWAERVRQPSPQRGPS